MSLSRSWDEKPLIELCGYDRYAPFTDNSPNNLGTSYLSVLNHRKIGLKAIQECYISPLVREIQKTT